MDKPLDFSAILASSVHDMKNSLSMLLNMLEEIADLWHPTEPESADKLAQLQYESKRLNHQLVQLLTLYKIDKSQYFLNIGEHDVAEFLDEATLHHRELLARRGVTLDIDAPTNLSWFFDRNLVYGVINNVLNNAVRYAKDRVRVEARVEDDLLAIRVSDNGEGYPQELLNRHSHEQTGISFESGSTGLGLYFSQCVAALHANKDKHGYIRLDNQGLAGGGRFSLYLP